ncbi:c-type cytochrome biogenesis protein CcmI [Alteromonas sp. KS69]|jgi:cytochrome c-type biogenesis protein CcmI|uniref:Cytochrome c-type biogenesis protein n=1 Tax=Alteromonas naphthalenivorans TaxID=715451 RepID=F5Z4N8_ALTNA|nr:MULTISPECIES: c-type cytochrome biogenesis protein CcmI [Alteromonas]MBB68279.1 c-type cytochrome biogenesis protein CcmI [Rickettsiales bacterium]PHS50919.1 MAG: c-type cytochrome biogenesis protein CcmI [Alteromonas sp.]AEF04297.1 putative cytochrome c-type biogenesis protein [Alteromonas naphthalenivorans]MBO7920644.1 c-type cytochrome biogenesis protein CcmI [Alteromonas sp. K632G]RUP82740.1 c-type cytochrome biogenesis protein CcmI [Alteromonas sp. KS69]|tara:strand:- start:2135 stop:3433 length:1299 start_codon:yes stop_codon:yes gene_type:complete
MSWTEFYIVVSGLITLVLMLLAFPWLRRKNHAKADNLSNTQIVKQRLQELEREVQEGLITEHDMRVAVDELKVALVDESSFESTRTGTAGLPLLIGGLVAVVAGVVVYASVNQFSQVQRASDAIAALPELSAQLASGNGSDLGPEDVANLALAIRQRLREAPEDDTGWLYLGRLMLSLGQEVQAIEAIDKAVALKPGNTSHQITLAQALMTTGDVNNLNRAQGVLKGLLRSTPENDNLALMMAVVSAQLGDLENLTRYYGQVKDKLPAGNDIGQRLAMREQELQAQDGQVLVLDNSPIDESSGTQAPAIEKTTSTKTGFNITVNVSDEARSALPQSGFLIVFAQDANSENRMPAAVVKIPLQDFPVTIALDTDNAMMPQYTLDSLSKVTLTARVSADGDVSVSPGEWEGSQVTEVAPQNVKDINVMIEKELL